MIGALESCTRPYAIWVLPGATSANLTFGLGRYRRRSQAEPFIKKFINSIVNRTQVELRHQTYSVDQIAVFPCFGLKYARVKDAVWRLDADGTANALRTFKYGAVPTGFREVHRAPSLALDKCYAISVSGAGFHATTEFRILGNGLVTELSEEAQNALGEAAFRREVAFGDWAVARCRATYLQAHSFSDTTRVDAIVYRDSTGEFGVLRCGFLRSPEGGSLQ